MGDQGGDGRLIRFGPGSVKVSHQQRRRDPNGFDDTQGDMARARTDRRRRRWRALLRLRRETLVGSAGFDGEVVRTRDGRRQQADGDDKDDQAGSARHPTHGRR